MSKDFQHYLLKAFSVRIAGRARMKPTRVLASILLVLGSFQISSASTISETGNFTSDDNVVLVPFSLAGNSMVTMFTTSFADGSKGFEPVLTLFDGSGNLLLQDATGGTAPSGCGSRIIDPVSGFCLDALIESSLGAGSYTLALSEWDNIPGGPTLADGFPQAGNGNFTATEFGCSGSGGFFLFNCSQRNSDWALQINSSNLQPAPEPPAGLMVVTGIFLATAVVWRRG